MRDVEKIVITTAASIAVLGVGYLIWRHEQTIQAVNQQATQAANDAAEAQYVQELEQSAQQGISGSTPLVYGNGASYETYDDGANAITSSGGTGSASDSNIQAILNAFFPNGTSNSTGNGTASTSTNETQPTPVTVNPPTIPQPINGTVSSTTPITPIRPRAL